MKRNSKTWILVANRAAAKLFEGTAPPTLLQAIVHPEGKLKASEINADRSGRAFPRHGSGSSSLDKANDPSSREADRFAHVLAMLLERGAFANAYGSLIIIAEPRFLGLLRACLAPPAATRLRQSLSADIAGLEGEQLRSEVMRILGEVSFAA